MTSAAIMARELPDLKSKAPKFELPDIAVRALALVDKRMRTILPELGEMKDYTNAQGEGGVWGSPSEVPMRPRRPRSDHYETLG